MHGEHKEPRHDQRNGHCACNPQDAFACELPSNHNRSGREAHIRENELVSVSEHNANAAGLSCSCDLLSTKLDKTSFFLHRATLPEH